MKRNNTVLRTALVLLIAALLFMTGCSKGASGKKLKDDTSVMELNFKAPAEYTEIERFSQFKDGVLYEKDITYSKGDDNEVVFAYMSDAEALDSLDLSSFGTMDVDGNSFHVRNYGDSTYVLGTVDGGLYAIYVAGQGEGGWSLDDAVAGITFKKTDKTVTDDDVIEGITYSLDGNYKVVDKTVTVTEDSEGKMTKKNMTLTLGKDSDNPEYRLRMTVYKDKTIDDVLSSGAYSEVNINGTDYRVVESDGQPLEYYAVKGNDVYQFKNSGISNGWFVTRSDESYEALKALVETVKYK